jgi:hypothetical protein
MNFDLGYRLRIRFLENDWNGIGLHMATRQQQRTHTKTAQEAKHYHPEFSLCSSRITFVVDRQRTPTTILVDGYRQQVGPIELSCHEQL